jgi:hypothetical protein
MPWGIVTVRFRWPADHGGVLLGSAWLERGNDLLHLGASLKGQPKNLGSSGIDVGDHTGLNRVSRCGATVVGYR